MDKSSKLAISLIDDLLHGNMPIQEFCARYEQHWNFDWSGRDLVPAADQFRRLFNVVVWYSPYPDERAAIPNYTGEEQVLAVAREVRATAGA